MRIVPRNIQSGKSMPNFKQDEDPVRKYLSTSFLSGNPVKVNTGINGIRDVNVRYTNGPAIETGPSIPIAQGYEVGTGKPFVIYRKQVIMPERKR